MYGQRGKGSSTLFFCSADKNTPSLFGAVPTPAVSLTADVSVPVPYSSSPILTCRVPLDAVNVAVTLSMEIDGPGGLLLLSADENLDGSAESYERNVTLGELTVGSGDGVYTCRTNLSSNQLTGFITDSEEGLGSLDITVEREYFC